MTPAMGYTQMKNSGIPWIGKLPSHWEIRRNKTVFSCEKSIVGEKSAETQLLSLTTNGIKMKSVDDTGGKIPESYDTYQYVHNNDIVMCLFDLDCSAVFSGISRFEGMISPAYKVLRCKDEIIPQYADYWFRSVFDGRKFKYLAKNIRYSLTYEDFSALTLPYPPKEEQQCIADYLDTQCAKIDEIIAEAKASIEEYKQWKASVIYEAVTKGLNPDVEMRDSGVEWIGEMPKSWTLLRVKNLLTEINHRSENGTEEPLSMSQVLGIVPSFMISVANPASSYVGAKIVEPNDLVFNKLKAHLGVFAVSNYTGLVSPDYAIYRSNEKVYPKFLEYLFKTPNCIQEFKKHITGVGAGLSRLYTSDLFDLKIALPPIKTQEQILEHLNAFCLQADALIAEKEYLVSDLESYKKSLIYEVVTGKRRVPTQPETTVAAIHPAYQKALLMCRVLDLLGDDARGRIHVQKCLFAIECLLKMPFQTQYARYQHGPYDTDIADYEALIGENDWFTVQGGSPVTYKKGAHFDAYLAEYMKIFADLDSKIKEIVEYLKPMKTAQAERVATLLAAWNDFILDGTADPTDQQIINEVMTNWTPNKANTQVSTWQATLDKLKDSGFVPAGFGVHTIRKEVQEV